MVRTLEGVDNVGAVELGFAPLLADDIILLAMEMSRGELPLIANLPAEQALRIGGRAIEHGATAVSLAAPRGTLTNDEKMISGRLFGPSLFPLAMHIIRSASKAGIIGLTKTLALEWPAVACRAVGISRSAWYKPSASHLFCHLGSMSFGL